jgi:hypothetical protein
VCAVEWATSPGLIADEHAGSAGLSAYTAVRFVPVCVSHALSISARFTSRDLERLPVIEGIRFEIVDGDLFVSKHPHWHHS